MERSLYTLKERKTIILVMLISLGIFLLYAMHFLFSAFLGAIVLYTIFRPIFANLIEIKTFKPWIASLLIIVSSFLIIILPFIIMITMIINKANYFINNHKDRIVIYFKEFKEFFGLEFTNQQFAEKGITFVQEVVVGKVSGALNELLSIFLTITIMYFVLYFMIVHYKTFENTLMKFMPFKSENNKKFAIELTHTTNANVLGQGFIAAVQGTLVGLAFWFFNYPDPFFWGVISMFLSFLPIIGAPIVFVPAAIIGITQGNYIGGYGLLIWGFGVVTNIDNVLRFLIAKRFANTPPLITILGVIIGFPIFGILGLVFGPLLISYFLILVKIYEERKLYSLEKMQVKKMKIKRKDFNPTINGPILPPTPEE